MAIPLPTGRRLPRFDVDHALDVAALAREHAFDLTLRRGSRPDGAWMTGWRRTALSQSFNNLHHEFPDTTADAIAYTNVRKVLAHGWADHPPRVGGQ
jgi:hypothetical protein